MIQCRLNSTFGILSHTHTLSGKKKKNTISIYNLGAINSRKFLTSSLKESLTNSNFVVAYIYCKDSKVETYLGVVYTLAALLVLCVMCFVGYIVWER